jgi:predicted site-specific integrase-resolvase
MPPLKPLLTADEAAEMLTAAGFPVSTETVRRWARKGLLAVVRSPGGAKGPKRFRREDIEAVLVSEKAGAA